MLLFYFSLWFCWKIWKKEEKRDNLGTTMMMRQEEGSMILPWLLLFLLFSSFSHGLLTSHTMLDRLSGSSSSSSNYLTQKEFWFNQTLDHFSPFVRFFLSYAMIILINLFVYLRNFVELFKDILYSLYCKRGGIRSVVVNCN